MSMSKVSRVHEEGGSRSGDRKICRRQLKPINCPFEDCAGKEFERSAFSDIWRHFEVDHGILPLEFVCGKCGKRFNTETKLVNHLKDRLSHAVNRCKYCHQHFKGSEWKQSLEKHVEKHHSPTRLANFFGKCGICSEYVLLMRLEIHIMMHFKQRMEDIKKSPKNHKTRKSSGANGLDGSKEDKEPEENDAALVEDKMTSFVQNQNSSLSPASGTGIASTDTSAGADDFVDKDPSPQANERTFSAASANINRKSAANKTSRRSTRKRKRVENDPSLPSEKRSTVSYQSIISDPTSSQPSVSCILPQEKPEPVLLDVIENPTFMLKGTTEGKSAPLQQESLSSGQPAVTFINQAQISDLVPSRPKTASDVEALLKGLHMGYSLTYDLSILKNCQYKIRDGQLFYEWILGPPSYDSETLNSIFSLQWLPNALPVANTKTGSSVL